MWGDQRRTYGPKIQLTDLASLAIPLLLQEQALAPGRLSLKARQSCSGESWIKRPKLTGCVFQEGASQDIQGEVGCTTHTRPGLVKSRASVCVCVRLMNCTKAPSPDSIGGEPGLDSLHQTVFLAVRLRQPASNHPERAPSEAAQRFRMSQLHP